MSIKCQINFENRSRVYYTGQWLRGTVQITLTKQQKVRGVYVRIFGKAHARWSEYRPSRTDGDRESHRSIGDGHYVYFTGDETYLNERTYFVGRRGGKSFKLELGTQVYHFQCLLPHGLPGSVKDPIGNINYGARVVFDVPLIFNIEFVEYFTIIKQIDLNLDPTYRMPAIAKNYEVFYPLGCCICCPSRPLTIAVQTPISGYTPGQTIQIKIEIDNQSGASISIIHVKLVQKLTFYGTSSEAFEGSSQRTRSYYIKSANVYGSGRIQNDIIYVNMRVPHTPSTEFTSQVIQIRYTIKVTINVDKFGWTKPTIEFPITIGSIPIQGSNEMPNMQLHPNRQAKVVPSQPISPHITHNPTGQISSNKHIIYIISAVILVVFLVVFVYLYA